MLIPVGPTAVKTLDHLELLWYPGPVLETLDVADVSAQGAVDGGAVRADQDPAADTRPARVRGPAVRAHGYGGPSLGLGAEHHEDHNMQHAQTMIFLVSIHFDFDALLSLITCSRKWQVELASKASKHVFSGIHSVHK